MSLVSRTASLISGLFLRGRLESEMDSELRFHMLACIEDQMRAGISREEAERRAARRIRRGREL